MEYLVTFLIVAAIVVFFVVWAVLTNKRQAERMKLLSQEQLDYLKNYGYSKLTQDGKLMKTVGVLTNIKESTSSNAPVDFIFYNCCTSRHEIGDSKIARDTISGRSLKIGDYIEISFKFKDGIIQGVKEIL